MAQRHPSKVKMTVRFRSPAQMLVLTFLLAFLVRLIALNQSLWLDEGTTARVIQQFNFSQIIPQFSPHDFHPPFYYLLLKLWTYLFGYSEIALRMPSVLFALGAGWFVYLIGKKLKDKKVGLWAAALFLFNPLIIYYSQEARMYMMVVFLLTGVLYYLVKVLDTQFFDADESVASLLSTGRKKLVFSHLSLCNIFIFLAFLTFYGSIFFIAAIYLYLLFKKQFKQLVLLLPGFVLALLLASPLLYQQYVNSQKQLALVINWSNVLGTVNLKNLLLIPLKFSIGRISWEPKLVYYALAGAWTVFVLWFTVKNFKISLFFLLVAPLILGVIFSFFSPLLQYFRFIYLIPVMALLLTIGTTKQWQKIVLLTGFSIFSLVYLLNPAFHREDWKSLAGSLTGVKSVYMIPSSADPLKYYKPKINIQDIRRVDIKEKEIIVIPYTTDIHGVDYKKGLTEKSYSQKQIKSFRELSYEVWTKKTL